MTQQLLAPCGNIDSLLAAINNGTDAVYLGIDRFNARIKADNFTLDNLKYWVDYAHLFGVKVYLTLNISIKDKEFMQALEIAKTAQNCLVDGLIITDIGLLQAVRFSLPDMYIIASTQLNVNNCLGANYISKWCNSIVAARECSIEQINSIAKTVNCDIECFAHGAVCVSVSGQCLFSSIVGGNSGNRGLCSQPCRQEYICTINKKQVNKGYLLSMRDLCTINNLNKFSNVKMLKIEGRLRRSQYVGQAVSSYRYALNNGSNLNSELVNLKKIYNRGDFYTGYLFDNNSVKLIDTSIVGHKGYQCGIITAVNGKNYIKASINLTKGDSFKVIREGKEVGHGTTISDINANNFASADFIGTVKPNDQVYVTTSLNQLAKIDNTKRRLDISFELIAVCNKNIELRATYKNIEVISIGEIVDSALTNPLTTEIAAKQLNKTKDTHFNVVDIACSIDNAYVSLSVLNNLRRDTLTKLQTAIIDNYNSSLINRRISKVELNTNNNDSIPNKFVLKNSDSVSNKLESDNLSINDCKLQKIENNNSVNININKQKLPATGCIGKTNKEALLIINESTDLRQLEIKFNSIFIIKPTVYSLDIIRKIIYNLPEQANIYLDLPNTACDDEINLLTSIITSLNIGGVVANNVYGIELATNLDLKLIAGLGLNIYNRYTADLLKRNHKDFKFIYSIELHNSEIWDDDCGYIYAEGAIVLMTLCHCPIILNTNSSCNDCKFTNITYTDKTNAKFTITRKKLIKCYFELINGVPISICHKLPEFRNVCINLIDNQAASQTISSYNKLFQSGKQDIIYLDKIYDDNCFTCGSYNRGVI